MSQELIEIEEEEYPSPLTGKVFKRILGLMRPHRAWVVGFLIAIALTSVGDAYFTFLNKGIVDSGIQLGDSAVLSHVAIIWGSLILFQAVTVFSFIYLAGILGERIQYDLPSKTLDPLQELSISYYAHTPDGRLIARVTPDPRQGAALLPR